jgi:ABC-type Mn2+/Zn2+ transport system permease subunit
MTFLGTAILPLTSYSYRDLPTIPPYIAEKFTRSRLQMMLVSLLLGMLFITGGSGFRTPLTSVRIV